LAAGCDSGAGGTGAWPRRRRSGRSEQAGHGVLGLASLAHDSPIRPDPALLLPGLVEGGEVVVLDLLVGGHCVPLGQESLGVGQAGLRLLLGRPGGRPARLPDDDPLARALTDLLEHVGDVPGCPINPDAFPVGVDVEHQVVQSVEDGAIFRVCDRPCGLRGGDRDPHVGLGQAGLHLMDVAGQPVGGEVAAQEHLVADDHRLQWGLLGKGDDRCDLLAVGITLRHGAVRAQPGTCADAQANRLGVGSGLVHAVAGGIGPHRVPHPPDEVHVLPHLRNGGEHAPIGTLAVPEGTEPQPSEERPRLRGN
jgi:hypothetical protein